MTRAEAIDRIKKLLRMKRGGTQGEIENALAAAARIAREHGIDMAGINPDEPDRDRLTHAEDVLKTRLPLEAKFAAAILVNYFSVEICMVKGRRYRVVFIGTAWDCEVARNVFIFLQRHFRYAWSHRENRRLKNREAFLDGMYQGLAYKLHQQKPQGEELVLASAARKNYLAKLFPDAEDALLPDEDSNADAARWAGMLAGKDTEIRAGLNKPAAPARPQLPSGTGQLELIS